jgi:uncharacterized delta-60 repeat protein
MPSYIELDKQSTFPASSSIGKSILGIGSNNLLQITDNNGSSTNVAGNAIKTYVAKLIQVDTTALYSGLLKIGEQYKITSYLGDDFSNVANVISGIINENDCIFIATGTTPSYWGSSTEITPLGNPIQYSLLSNTLGYDTSFCWGKYDSSRYYFNFLNAVDPSKVAAFRTPTIERNTNCLISYANQTDNEGFSNLVPYYFNYSFDNIPYTLSVQSDGKILAGGGFTYYNSQYRSYITRIYPSGQDDTTFYSNLISTGNAAGFNNQVNTIETQSDGKILVGGQFTQLNGNVRNYLVRLNSDGIEDDTFYTNLTSTGDTTGFDSYPNTLSVQSDGKILVGGNFNYLNGIRRNNLVRLNSDGTEDTTFYSNLTSSGNATGFNVPVNTIAIQSDGKILVGGSFTTLNGNTRNYLVRLNSDGTEDTSFYTNLTSTGDNSGFNDYVNTIAIQSDGKILVGGGFSTLNGDVIYQYLCRLESNGTPDSSYVIQPNNPIVCMALEPSDLLVIGGTFSRVFNGAESVPSLARLDVNGNLINRFSATYFGGGYPQAIAQQGYNRLMLSTDAGQYLYNLYSGFDVILSITDSSGSPREELNYMPIEIRNYS